MNSTALVWFRNDLRLHDHQALSEAIQHHSHCLAIYSDKPKTLKHTGLSSPGAFRKQFINEALIDLSQSLAALNIPLLVLDEPATEAIPKLIHEHKVDAVYAHREHAFEEKNDEQSLRNALNIPLKLYEGGFLVMPDDLPFADDKIPDIFTQFRKKVEALSTFRAPLPAPTKVMQPLELQASTLNPGSNTVDARTAFPFRGGEKAALQHLKTYIWENQYISTYKETRNGLLGSAYSSKMSPWLACGSLSPRKIYQEVKRFEQEVIANDSTYWLIFELLWRDYFRHVYRKFGARFFHRNGLALRPSPKKMRKNTDIFRRWTEGQTAEPFVDANMRELKLTGFMSNRGRQNVASFLVNDLGIDWRWGAEYFQHQLIDYDVYSNWGNWAYVSGVGNDPREDRYFNVRKQAQMYDPDGLFVKTWIGSLES